jgi:hypothetical protein
MPARPRMSPLINAAAMSGAKLDSAVISPAITAGASQTRSMSLPAPNARTITTKHTIGASLVAGSGSVWGGEASPLSDDPFDVLMGFRLASAAT